MARLDAMDIKALGLDWVNRSVRIRQRSGAGVSHRQHILVLEWNKAWCQCRAVFDLLDEESAYIPDNDERTYGYDLSGLLGVKKFELSHTSSVTSILGWNFGGDWAIAVPSGEIQKVRIECVLVISNNIFDMDHARRGVYTRLGKCGENRERSARYVPYSVQGRI